MLEDFFTEHKKAGDVSPIDVVDALHRLILNCTLGPGAKLRESELAARFNLSRTPIREALVALEREGLVVYERNRGYSVRRFSLRDLRDSFELRALLEGYACAAAAQRGLSDEGVALRACLAEAGALLEHERELGVGELLQLRERNVRFHAGLLELCDNAIFRRSHDMIERMPRPPDLAAAGSRIEFRMHRRYHDEHVRILDAVLSRNSGRAESLMREHLLQGCAELDRRMSEEAGKA